MRRFLFGAGTATLVLACTTTIINPNTGDGGNPGHDQNGSFTCCLNSVYYTCPNQSAFEKCAGFDVGQCMSKCNDPQCMANCKAQAAKATPDPSACAKQSGACPPITPSCNNPGFGTCDIDSDCSSGDHCTGGSCYSNSAGSKCDIDIDCGDGNHCTGACCVSNQSGSPCDIDADCGSNSSCQNGICS